MFCVTVMSVDYVQAGIHINNVLCCCVVSGLCPSRHTYKQRFCVVTGLCPGRHTYKQRFCVAVLSLDYVQAGIHINNVLCYCVVSGLCPVRHTYKQHFCVAVMSVDYVQAGIHINNVLCYCVAAPAQCAPTATCWCGLRSVSLGTMESE